MRAVHYIFVPTVISPLLDIYNLLVLLPNPNFAVDGDILHASVLSRSVEFVIDMDMW